MIRIQEPVILEQTRKVLAPAKNIDDVKSITERVIRSRFHGRSQDEIDDHVADFIECWDSCDTDQERLKVAQSTLDYSS